MKTVLTIAGYDASNGAGVTKDLEVFSSLGFHGLSVPTCLVVQGPAGAATMTPVAVDPFSGMLREVGKDFDITGIKVGILPEARHVEVLTDFLAFHKGAFVVLDPVRAAKNGLRLTTDEAMTAVMERLLPHLTTITPNLDEAAALLGREIDDLNGMEWAARELVRKGAKSALIKGGHLAGEPVDLLFDGERVSTHRKNRTDKEVHGTGCLFSSTLVSFLAMSYPLGEAFSATETAMERLLEESAQPAETGYFYTFPAVSVARDGERWQVLQAMYAAAEQLQRLNVVELIPAVQMNIGYALRDARGVEDVAAFPGRIGHRAGKIFFKGMPEFGASSHVARLCLTCMKHYPFLRAGVDLKYDEGIVEKAKSCGFTVIFWDRMKEPDDIKRKEGMSLDFLVDAALREAKKAPDIIYDHGDVGKEPIIRLFGRDPQELINKMEMIRP
jgi:hydroxymethylpyrimidine kinase / phosphomethylpyrimidine kinase / thiamine-phosphate diphosphorylase